MDPITIVAIGLGVKRIDMLIAASPNTPKSTTTYPMIKAMTKPTILMMPSPSAVHLVPAPGDDVALGVANCCACPAGCWIGC